MTHSLTRLIGVLAVVLVTQQAASAMAEPASPAHDILARRHVVSAEIAAPVSAAWTDWTTEEGVQSFFAPGSKVELTPGGVYEVHFLPDAPEGQRGSEGTSVLGFQKERMLSITWALPPYMEAVRPHLTPLTVYFEPVGDDRTKVTVVHGGWGTGPDWDKAYAYFEKAWPQVLAAHAKKYAGD